MHIFHKWSVWKLINVNVIWYNPNGGIREQGTREKQERVCTVCGLRQRKDFS